MLCAVNCGQFTPMCHPDSLDHLESSYSNPETGFNRFCFSPKIYAKKPNILETNKIDLKQLYFNTNFNCQELSVKHVILCNELFVCHINSQSFCMLNILLPKDKNKLL